MLKKWLSYQEGVLLGRALREDEAGWFAEVARRIAGILLLGPELDASYRAILPGGFGVGGAGTRICFGNDKQKGKRVCSGERGVSSWWSVDKADLRTRL